MEGLSLLRVSEIKANSHPDAKELATQTGLVTTWPCVLHLGQPGTRSLPLVPGRKQSAKLFCMSWHLVTCCIFLLCGFESVVSPTGFGSGSYEPKSLGSPNYTTSLSCAILQLNIKFPRPYLGMQSQEYLRVKPSLSPENSVYRKLLLPEQQKAGNWPQNAKETAAFPCLWICIATFAKEATNGNVRRLPGETMMWSQCLQGEQGCHPGRRMSTGEEDKEKTGPQWARQSLSLC